jgi:hypothetical protein
MHRRIEQPSVRLKVHTCGDEVLDLVGARRYKFAFAYRPD